MNVRYSIQGQSREYKLFIAHHVGEIQEFSAPNQWCYVPTDVNLTMQQEAWNKKPESKRAPPNGGMGPNCWRSQNKTGQSASLASQYQQRTLN